MEPEQVIKQVEQDFRRAYASLPIVLGNSALNFALDNFRMQGFLGYSFQRWQDRKDSWKKDKRPNRAILVEKGTLRRAGRIVFANHDGVMLGWDVPYARAHNEGLRIGQIQTVKAFTRRDGTAVSGHTRKIDQNIPRRTYIADSPYLQMKMKREGGVHFLKYMRYLKP